MSVWSDKHFKVGDSEFEGCLTVCPAPDYPDNGVLLFAESEKDKEAYGPVYLQLGADMMRAIGKALIDCADEVQRK